MPSSTLQVSQVKYHTKAMSTFHQINAFEEDGFLMLDMCCSDDGQAINNYLIQNLRKSGDALDEVRIELLTHTWINTLCVVTGGKVHYCTLTQIRSEQRWIFFPIVLQLLDASGFTQFVLSNKYLLRALETWWSFSFPLNEYKVLHQKNFCSVLFCFYVLFLCTHKR